MTAQRRLGANSTFLLAVFLDGVTLSLMFPLLNELLVNAKTSLLPHDTSAYDREFTYSVVLFIYMVSWAWGNALISSLSDVLGRKPTLLISMVGKISGFVLLLISIQSGSLVLLVISRIVDGLTNGVQPEAEAVGIDLSPSRGLRPAYIGYLLLPVALGDTVGSYLLAIVKDLTWLGPDLILRPVYFGLVVSIAAFVLIAVGFRETFEPSQARRVDLLYPLRIFRRALADKELRILGAIFLLTVVGWSLFFDYLQAFASTQAGLSDKQTQYLLIMPGLGFVVAWTALVRLFNRAWNTARVFIVLKSVAAICLVLLLAITSPPWLFITVFIAAASNSTAYVTMLAMFANSTDKHNQGWVMGIAGALHFAGFGLSSLLAAPLLKISYTALFVAASVAILLSVASVWYFRHRAWAGGSSN